MVPGDVIDNSSASGSAWLVASVSRGSDCESVTVVVSRDGCHFVRSGRISGLGWMSDRTVVTPVTGGAG